MNTNTYTTLRKNASLTAVADAAVISAKRAWAAVDAYKDAMPKGLLSWEQQSTLSRLTSGAMERSDLATHLARLATK
jgi:hypothetical protein